MLIGSPLGAALATDEKAKKIVINKIRKFPATAIFLFIVFTSCLLVQKLGS